jgi:undecaprenyl phosphate-alpha-L-ara4N flippase subunit ArnE
MWRIILLSTLQSLLLAGGQVFLKFAMMRMGAFSLSWGFVGEFLRNWYMLATGVCMGLASILWLYMIKHFAFSVVYPMISISYIFGMLAAIYVFQESVSVVRWIGVLLIMAGVVLIAK